VWRKNPATAGPALFLAASLGHYRQQRSGFERHCLPIAKNLSVKFFSKHAAKVDLVEMIVNIMFFRVMTAEIARSMRAEPFDY